MAQFSKSTFRGLLLPDTRIKESSIDLANSSFTQADPQVGIPVPNGQTDLNLEATGTQSASKALMVATQRGGHPGRGLATFRWKNASESATSYRGVWPANTISGWSTVRSVNPSTSSGRRAAKDPHAVFMNNNKIGVVYAELHYALSTSYYRIAFFTVDKDGTASADTIIYSSLSDNEGLHPCILKLPSGRLMIYHYLEGSNDTCNVQSWYSDNDGASWTVSNTSTLDLSIDVQSGSAGFDLDTRPSAKMRAAYSGGQVLLVISARSNDTSGAYQDCLIQYASSDLGLSFQHVETSDRTISATQGEVVDSSNGFEVFYAGGTAGNDAVIRKSLSSAFIPISGATQQAGPGVLNAGNWAPGGIALKLNVDAEIAATRGDDGILYVMARGRHSSGTYASSNTGDIRVCMDVSGGASKNTVYRLMGQGTSGTASGAANAGTVYFAEASSDYPRYFGLVPAWGRLHLFHNHVASTATRDDAMGWMQLGGYNTTTLGAYNEEGSLARRVCWDINYLPFETPNNFPGWTTAVSGTNSASVNDGYLELSTGVGKLIYHKTPTGTIAEGMIAHFGVQFISSSGLGTDMIFARFQAADGSDKHTLDVYIRDGHIDVQDNNGGAVLGTLAMDTKTIGVEILVFFRSGKATVFAKQRDNKPDELWSTVCSNVTVSDSGTGSMEIRFGHKVSTTAVSKWFFLNYVSDEYAGGTPYSTGFTNPDDLIGQPFNSIGSTWVDDGVSIRGINGPTISGDFWDISTRYGYGIGNIDPVNEPSPDKGWRSTNESQNTIIWDLTGANSYRTLGLYLDGCNWKTGTLYGWNAVTSAWDTFASINMATGQTGLAYNRGGNTVTVNTGATTTAGRYFEKDEFVDGTIDLGSSKFRTVSGNSAGIWTNAANNQLPGIEFSGLDGSEPASGTLDIWSSKILICVHDIANAYTKFKLDIAAQQTATDDLRIGTMVLGPLYLFTHDYSFGRSISNQANTDLVTYSNGQRSAFKRGKNRKTISFGWGEGVDTTPIQGATPTPDYVLSTSSSGAKPIGYRGDMASVLNQLHSFVSGPNLPIVYCASIDAGSTGNDTKTIQGMGAAVYGRIVSDISVDSIVGDELDPTSGELMRIAQMTIEEEL